MSWFEKLMPTSIRTDSSTKRGVPEGLWTKCTSCNAVLYRAELERNLDVCPKCNHHFRISAEKRIESIVDEGSFIEYDSTLAPVDRCHQSTCLHSTSSMCHQCISNFPHN